VFLLNFSYISTSLSYVEYLSPLSVLVNGCFETKNVTFPLGQAYVDNDFLFKKETFYLGKILNFLISLKSNSFSCH